MKAQKRGRRKIRSQDGSLGYLLIGIVLLSCFGIAALAVDFAHGVLVRSQLQNACDAAALGGIQDLIGSHGPLTGAQINQVETDSVYVGGENFADNFSVSVTANNPPPTYNSGPYTSTNPEYTVIATASSNVGNIFARMFGHNSEIVTATSRAGLFPQSTKTHVFGNLGEITAPIGAALDVHAHNEVEDGVALDQLHKGDAFELHTNSSTGGSGQNAAWIQLKQGVNESALSPLATKQSISSQFAAQKSPGIITLSNGNTYAFMAGGGNHSVNDKTGWMQFILQQIAANGGSINMTVPLFADPNGDSDSGSMKQNTELQIVGIATFNITNTSRGPSGGISGDSNLFGTLVNALALNENGFNQFAGFFGQFQGGNNQGNGNASSGTQQMRLY